jgi:integrase
MRQSTAPWYRKSKNCWFVWQDGKLHNLFVKGDDNEAEAVKAWHRLMAGDTPVKPAQRADPIKVKADNVYQPTATRLTLSALVKAFLADAEQRVKPESYRGYAKFLNPLAEAFSDIDAERLTKEQVERFSRKPEWSQSYRCGFIGTAVSLFKWAVEIAGLLTRNPIAGIRKPAKQSRGRKAIISADDHAKLLTLAKGDWKAFLSLLWETGARPGEIAGLTADAVCLNSKTAILTEHKTAEQTGKDRLIVLTDDAVAILQTLIAKRPTGLLFPGANGQRLNANNVACRMRRLCQRAGVKAFAYGYRHTFGTTALASGVPDAVVAALMGHSTTAMLHKHYSHLTSKTAVLRSALEKVRA